MSARRGAAPAGLVDQAMRQPRGSSFAGHPIGSATAILMLPLTTPRP